MLARKNESAKKAIKLFEDKILDQLFSSLKAIHKYLFDNIYEFAGEIRNVNITKGNFRFAPLMYLEASLENIDKMPHTTFEEIIEKYVEMNITHPFRKGNGEVLVFGLIKFILKKALTRKINNREVYMKGIDYSYYYEGYNTFKTNEL